MVMPLVGGASCGVSDWMKPRLSMRLVREGQRGVRSAVHDLSFTNIRRRDTNGAAGKLHQQIVLLVMRAGVEVMRNH